MGIDFGVKYKSDTCHGNIVFRLANDKTLRANSLILSLNSPVFDHLITDLGQSEIFLDQFDEGAATRFFRALYCGEIGKLTRLSQLQDMAALAHIYNIPWLTNRCLNFFLDNPYSRVTAEFIRKVEKSETWLSMDADQFKCAAEEQAAKMPPPIKMDPLPPRPLSFMRDGSAKKDDSPLDTSCNGKISNLKSAKV